MHHEVAADHEVGLHAECWPAFASCVVRVFRGECGVFDGWQFFDEGLVGRAEVVDDVLHRRVDVSRGVVLALCAGFEERFVCVRDVGWCRVFAEEGEDALRVDAEVAQDEGGVVAVDDGVVDADGLSCELVLWDVCDESVCQAQREGARVCDHATDDE